MRISGLISLFMPSAENRLTTAWWAFSFGLFAHMLGILGFEVKRTTHYGAHCLVPGEPAQQECAAFVAHRRSDAIFVEEAASFSNAAA
jgi:hypothetical protein